MTLCIFIFCVLSCVLLTSVTTSIIVYEYVYHKLIPSDSNPYPIAFDYSYFLCSINQSIHRNYYKSYDERVKNNIIPMADVKYATLIDSLRATKMQVASLKGSAH